MKKTFTISLGHSVFNVEEDAYDVLKIYLDSIKNYFQKMEMILKLLVTLN